MLKKLFSFCIFILIGITSCNTYAYLKKNRGIYDENGVRVDIDKAYWAGFQGSSFIDELYSKILSGLSYGELKKGEKSFKI